MDIVWDHYFISQRSVATSSPLVIVLSQLTRPTDTHAEGTEALYLSDEIMALYDGLQ